VIMKVQTFLGMAAVAGLALVSCKSPVYVQKDQSANFANYHTYTWVETKANDHDNKQRATGYADISIRNSVNDELAKEGWTEASDNPDILVSYDVLVRRATREESNAVYTTPFTRMYYNPWRGRWSTIYYPSQFAGYETYDQPVKEGTITITMTDAKTDKVVWQAWTTEQLNYARLTPDEINKGIRNIFGKFDVASR